MLGTSLAAFSLEEAHLAAFSLTTTHHVDYSLRTTHSAGKQIIAAFSLQTPHYVGEPNFTRIFLTTTHSVREPHCNRIFWALLILLENNIISVFPLCTTQSHMHYDPHRFMIGIVRFRDTTISISQNAMNMVNCYSHVYCHSIDMLCKTKATWTVPSVHNLICCHKYRCWNIPL